MYSVNVIYADYAATTPLEPEVVRAMAICLEEGFFNPSSLYTPARKIKTWIEDARASVASLIGAGEDEIIFTSGGTESDNMAIIGSALLQDDRKRHIITSAIEHHAVLESCRWLESMGFSLTILPVDSYGRVDPQTLKAALREDSFLVSIMMVNNEIGVIQDIKNLASLAHEAGALFHTDAVQAMCTQKVDVAELDVDLLTLSSHKFYGPKGCGALYLKAGAGLAPIIHGGQQEGSLRGGTENVPAICGMGVAANILRERREDDCQKFASWKNYLISELVGDGVINNSPEVSSAPSLLNLGVKDLEAEGILFWLDRRGVCVSMGAACDTQSLEPSHVIDAIGVPPPYRRGCIRISLGRYMDDDQVTRLAKTVKETIEKLRR